MANGARPFLRGHQRLEKLEQGAAAMPELARHVVAEGVRRLAAYQDWKYARLYLDRLHPILETDQRGRERADGCCVKSRDILPCAIVVRGRRPRSRRRRSIPARMVRITGELGVTAKQAVPGRGVPQARHRRVLSASSVASGAAHPAPRQAVSVG